MNLELMNKPNIFSNKSTLFCNNCGKFGHTFNLCKYPITSIGVIAFRYNTDHHHYEYLMIQRKHTLGFVDFMRGRYSLHNLYYIMNIINEMTNYEKQLLLTKSFEELWEYLWDKKIINKYKNEKQISEMKFTKLKLGIQGIHTISLETCISKSSTSWNNPEWGFPKGRRNYKEKDFETGIREFCEETGYKKHDIDIIHNIQPFEEIFTGSNYKSYKHKYFLGQINNINYNLKNFDKYEVRKQEWKTLEECILSIRPYNVEKINLINNINNILNTYKFCYEGF